MTSENSFGYILSLLLWHFFWFFFLFILYSRSNMLYLFLAFMRSYSVEWFSTWKCMKQGFQWFYIQIYWNRSHYNHSTYIFNVFSCSFNYFIIFSRKMTYRKKHEPEVLNPTGLTKTEIWEKLDEGTIVPGTDLILWFFSSSIHSNQQCVIRCILFYQFCTLIVETNIFNLKRNLNDRKNSRQNEWFRIRFCSKRRNLF